MDFRKPTGTQDIAPGTVERWQYLEQKARDLCRRFGYDEIRTPIFEQTELFRRGVGETTDVVEKEMYTFEDKGKRSMTLRPEGTAGVVRAYLENKMYGEPDIAKLFYIGPMFRYERPQAGRYRQLHQFGAEAFGSNDPAIDAEIIALGYLFYTELGIQGVTLELNSVGNPASREAYRERLLEFLNPLRSDLCQDCQSRIDRNPLRVLDCKVDQEKFAAAPSILDSLDEECTAHFASVQRYLTAMDIPFSINHRMVRGLDYYTHTAFEYKAAGIGAIDTIGGGGRYNGLVEQVGGPEQPGIGFGIGLERTLLILEHQKIDLPVKRSLDVYLVTMGEAASQKAVELVYEWRRAGLSVDQDYQDRKIRTQMRSAVRSGAQYAAILGEDELANGELTLKNLQTEDQVTIRLSELVSVVQQDV